MPTQKTALVTGGNRGLGLETSKTLAELGYFVFVGTRNLEKGRAAIGNNKNMEAVLLDVADPKSIRSAYEVVSKKISHLDALVNNAGIMIEPRDQDKKEGAICTTDVELIDRVFRNNTLSAILMVQTFLPLLQKSPAPRVINVSSGMGQLSEMGGHYPAYRISKTALNAVTRIFSSELEDTQFKINSVCPGWVRTDMGGKNATRSLQEGADTIVWAATLPSDGPTGTFLRDRKSIDW